MVFAVSIQEKAMSRVCEISGVGPMKGHRRRHPHSGAWNLRAPKKNHTFLPNLQTVTIRTPEGKVRLKVTTSVMSSPDFQDYCAGVKPLPEHLKKGSQHHIKK
jgi:large subunit ribosomal protein L28